MSKKIRLTLTNEYEPDPKFYRGLETIEEMAQCDADAEEWEMLFSDSPLNIQREILDEDGVVIARGTRNVNY